VTDGPFAEAKEVLGGYWMIQVKSKEEAIEWAKRCPGSDNEMIEVRQVHEFADFPADVQEAAAKFPELLNKSGQGKGRDAVAVARLGLRRRKESYWSCREHDFSFDRLVQPGCSHGPTLAGDRDTKAKRGDTPMSSTSTHTPSQKTTVLLWIIQGLLALVFMFAGVMKFVMPIEEMTKQVPLPGLFLRFIGVAEVLGRLA